MWAEFATAHDMLPIVNALLRGAMPHDDQNIEYEWLYVERKSPRPIRMLDKGNSLPAINSARPSAK